MPRLNSRALVVALALVTIGGCDGDGHKDRTIVVPPPPSAAADPSPLANRQANPSHVHALLPVAGGLLLGTHQGLAKAAPGSPSVPQPGIRGDVLQLVPGPPGLLLLAGHNLGVQASRDGGATWGPVAPEMAGLDVHGLASDPRDRTQLFAYAVGRGIFASVDAGAHWQHLAGAADSPSLYISGLAVTGDGTLLAGSPQLGVAASTDRGRTFVSVYQGVGQVYSISAASGNGDVVIVAGERGLFLTQDGGAHWSAGQTSDPLTAVYIDPNDSQTFFAGGSDGLVFASPDSGGSWKSY